MSIAWPPSASGVMQALRIKSYTPGFREHVGKFLLRHPERLEAEECIEEPGNLLVGGGRTIAVPRKRLQLAFLAFEPAAETNC